MHIIDLQIIMQSFNIVLVDNGIIITQILIIKESTITPANIRGDAWTSKLLANQKFERRYKIKKEILRVDIIFNLCMISLFVHHLEELLIVGNKN